MKAIGLQPGALLRHSGLPLTAYSGESLVTTAQNFALWRSIRALSSDPTIGWADALWIVTPLRASVLFCVPWAVAMAVLVPLVHSTVGLALTLAVWGICQSALFTVSHTRVMKATASTPALDASLNISGANFGIALGALLGSRVIDPIGLAKVSMAAAVIVVLAIAAAAFAMLNRPRQGPTKAIVLDAAGDVP